LIAKEGGEPVLPLDSVKIIFSDIEVINQVNSVLYDKISQRWKNWSVNQLIGDIFVSLGASLKVYAQYINNYERSLNLLTEARKNPVFTKWVEPREKKVQFHVRLFT
jgi:hypothetical protein